MHRMTGPSSALTINPIRIPSVTLKAFTDADCLVLTVNLKIEIRNPRKQRGVEKSNLNDRQ